MEKELGVDPSACLELKKLFNVTNKNTALAGAMWMPLATPLLGLPETSVGRGGYKGVAMDTCMGSSYAYSLLLILLISFDIPNFTL